jgi:hypothetical protein
MQNLNFITPVLNFCKPVFRMLSIGKSSVQTAQCLHSLNKEIGTKNSSNFTQKSINAAFAGADLACKIFPPLSMVISTIQYIPNIPKFASIRV